MGRKRKKPYRMLCCPRRPRGVPAARVVLDPDDDRAVLRSIELLSNPPGGVAVVTPTPGNVGSGVLYHDILNAVGRWSYPRWLYHSERTMGITRDLLRRRKITGLIVVRAHSLSPSAWYRLGWLAKKTPLRLWLVVHGCMPRPQLLAALARSGVPMPISRGGTFPLSCLPGTEDSERRFYENPPGVAVRDEVAFL